MLAFTTCSSVSDPSENNASNTTNTSSTNPATCGGAGGKNVSEARLVPNLIFQIEQYNVSLIKLAKSVKLDEPSLARMILVS